VCLNQSHLFFNRLFQDEEEEEEKEELRYEGSGMDRDLVNLTTNSEIRQPFLSHFSFYLSFSL
jgi:hypothetical protein